METLLASLPVLLLAGLLFGLGWRLVTAAPFAFLTASAVAMGWWSVPPSYILSALAKSTLLSIDIMLIVFGAVFFIQYLRRLGLIVELQERLRELSPDRRVQAILLAWLFGSFVEGMAGFGTPAVIVAPLLVSIGFPALTSIVICLVANSTAVAFGAVGTPIRIGFSGLETGGVAVNAAMINVVAGFMIPFVILFYVCRDESRDRLMRFQQGVPWAIFAGAVFLIPYFVFAHWGQEFPALLGAAVGLLLAGTALKMELLVPKSKLVYAIRSPNGNVGANSDVGIGDTEEFSPHRGYLRPLTPYLLLLALLMVGKFVFGNFHLDLNLGSGLIHSFQLFNPGFAFFTTILLMSLSNRTSIATLSHLASSAMKPLGLTAVSIFFVSATTYTMIVTGAGSDPGMMESITRVIMSPWLPLYAPFIGALGAFLAGSATVSNLLFGTAQMEAAIQTGYQVNWILALQLVGAGAGNMIALPNLVAVQAAVGITGEESRLLRRLIVPCILYLLVTTLAGVLLMS